MLIRKNHEFSPRPFVRSFVRSFVRPFRTSSKTVHYFSLKLGSLLELRKAEKMVQALFWKKSRFAHFGQKLSKIGHFWPKCPKMEVFRIFLGIPSLLFSETLQLISAFNSQKIFQTLFWKKVPFCQFWPKIGQNWPFGWRGAQVSLSAGNPWKTWK